MTVRILIGDDHGVVRGGLRALLHGAADMQVIGRFCVRGGWADVAARVPQLRPASASRRHGLPGFIAVGLAMSAAATVLIAVMAQAWLYQPPLDATAFVASSTPTASATYTPERATRVATPVSWMYIARLQSPRPLPVAATAKP